MLIADANQVPAAVEWERPRIPTSNSSKNLGSLSVSC